MHCPRCGQQQVSDETKFCSRCGFQLGLVSELLANGGFLPQLAELYKGRSTIFTRKNGVIFSILWFILFVMMIPAFFAIANIDGPPEVSAAFGFFTTLMFLIISLGFLKKTPKAYELRPAEVSMATPAAFHGTTDFAALPSQRQQPATDYTAPSVGSWRAPDTGDLVPGSIVEGTTKLLKKDRES